MLGLHRNGVDGDFYTAVADLADIGEEIVVVVRRHRNGVVVEQVGGETVIVVDGTAQTSLEEGEVQTDVELGFLFPGKVRVGIAGRGVGRGPGTVIVEVAVGLYEEEGFVVGEILVAGHSESGPEFEFVQPLDVLHKALLADAPAQAHCREPSPFVVGSETAGTVAAQGNGCHIPFGIVVHHPAEEGYVAVGFFVGA